MPDATPGRPRSSAPIRKLLLGLRGVARAIGYVASLLLLAAFLLLGARWVQVTLFYAPAEPERMAAKRDYLASIPRVSPDAPNFVVIFFDDLGWGDLSSYGNQLIRTPRIDALAAQGVRMSDFYSGAPVCTASRAALLSGRHPNRSGAHRHVFFSEASPIATLRKMAGWGNELARDEILLPEVLQAAGYATGMVGKWHLGGIPGHMPNDFGFDRYYGVLWSNDMTPLHVYRNADIEEPDRRRGERWTGGFRDATSDRGDGLDQRRLTERYTREAIAFMRESRDQPFFLYFAHTFPHVPHFASPEHAGESAGGVYGDVVEDLDRSVGAVLDALAGLGLSERTLVIVTSDNGADYNGSPGFLRGRKGDTYEGGQRVPMIARWPGHIPAGLETAELGSVLDVFPTLLARAGIAPPEDRAIDGVDLMPLLSGRGPSPREWLFYVSAFDGTPEAVRDRRFKYRGESGDVGRSQPQLWRMDGGPETHNLAATFPDDSERLARELARFRDELAENPRGWK